MKRSQLCNNAPPGSCTVSTRALANAARTAKKTTLVDVVCPQLGEPPGAACAYTGADVIDFS